MTAMAMTDASIETDQVQEESRNLSEDQYWYDNPLRHGASDITNIDVADETTNEINNIRRPSKSW